MRFLLDQGLPRSTVEHLQVLGHHAEHVGLLGMATALTVEAELLAGSAVSVSHAGVRVRRLPLI